jgi:hypothetical protein
MVIDQCVRLFGVVSLFQSFESSDYACAHIFVGLSVDEMKRMDVVFDFVFLWLSHTPLFNRVMNQFEAAEMGDLQQLRVALTVNNVNAVDSDGWTALHCYNRWIC